MTDRYDVLPHHLLQAVLQESFAADVLRALDVEPDAVQVTLAERWLAASDTIDSEEVESLGVEVGTLMRALNPAAHGPPQWDGRRLTPPARDVMVRALGICGALRHQRVTSGHLLLALLTCKDTIVVATLAAHGLRAMDVEVLVRQWGRRTT